MATFAPAGAINDEPAEDGAEDSPIVFHRPSKKALGADEYIDKIIGPIMVDSDSDEHRLPRSRPTAPRKGKRKAVGERLEWSDDDEEVGVDVYERFVNRHKAKRKRAAAAKKELKSRAKTVVEDRKRAKANGEQMPKKKEGVWGDVEDLTLVDDEIPDYWIQRRQEFDRRYDDLEEAGLNLPPRYHDVEFSDDERLENLKERPDFPPSVEPSRAYEDVELPRSGGTIPASIARYLRDYQVDGVAYLHEKYVYQKGMLLGDDMGLGKTVQIAAFLTTAFGKTGDERDSKRMRKMRRAKKEYPRVLIVCPGSLIDNWKNELNRWGYWHIDKYHGAQNEREAVLNAAKSGMLEIVITTYSTYRNHVGEINLVNWDCVVADECHQLKEGTSAITKAMNQINALCRIGLSGTAIQNKYEEMWNLLNWTNPGDFGPIYTWNQSICEPLRIGQSHGATYHQLKQARQTARRLVENLLPRYFLRRMKSLIAHQLPKKTDKVIFCPLSDDQREAYEAFLESDIVKIVRCSGDLCDCNSGRTNGHCCHETLADSNTHWMALVFPVITILQKLSNHLALLIPHASDTQEKQARDLEFLQKTVPDKWERLYATRASLLNLANPDFCGKWKILKDLLRFWHGNGDKVLIFSHSVRLLKMLQYLFRNTSYNVSFLDGSIPYEQRQITVDDFNSDPNQFVFLISTKAGGVGLNITSANKVVIFDPNWNPSYDLQAQDRAYRIGQRRDVEVYRLVSAGTVEEIVYARQIYKQQQANIGYNASTERRYFEGVQGSKHQKGEIFGLHNLLSFHDDRLVLRDIVNKTNVAEAKRGLDVLDIDMEFALNDEDNPLRVEDDNGDGAMSQLAALITEGEDTKTRKRVKPKPKTDAIQAILASAGVQYTHENSEVVGSSRVEAELSRRAEETGNDVDYGEQRLFAESQGRGREGEESISYLYHPPEDVMSRQFCTMAETFGFKSATDFAFVVEGWTQKQRTDCLERFYLKRKEKLKEMEVERTRSDKVYTGGVDQTDSDVEMAGKKAGLSGVFVHPILKGGNYKERNDGRTEAEIETEEDDDDELL